MHSETEKNILNSQSALISDGQPSIVNDKLAHIGGALDMAKDMIFISDPAGNIEYANAEFKKILGYTSEVIENGLSINLLFTDSQIGPGILEKVNALQRFSDQTYLRSLDGSEIAVLISATPIINENNEILGILFISNNIGQCKKAQQRQAELLDKLDRVNKELTDFAYIISHDLKAPLRGINTLSEMIVEDYAEKFDEEGREQLGLLRKRVSRMHDLVEGVLQYSRIGRIKDELELLDLNEILNDVVDMLEVPKNIKIEIDSDLPKIYFEKNRIVQVFQNLLSNAVKFNDKDDGQIKISHKRNGDFYQFIVADNGCGIAQKDFENIFKIFQTASTNSENIESTGIGLTIVKKIIEFYGGHIWVESEPGRETKFYFTINSKQGD